MVLLAQDISARIRAEQSRRDFVANVSHELRTPLTVVNGYVENLIDSGEVPEKWERPIQLMEQQVLRMRHIIEDLLTLAKLDGAEPEVQEPINISGLCERVAAEARSMTTHHEIKVACLTDAQLIGDGKQIYSALSNLVTNAIKYSGDDTLITIAWQVLPRGLSLSVTDSGDGIARQHLSRLTERFYRVDTARSREKGGTGLGLAIVNSIIDQHGGKLEVDSEVGKGSQFSCIFPKSLAVYEPNLKITAEG
jgi:two-component system phosphate regulon sensor histidine kinase PhoR